MDLTDTWFCIGTKQNQRIGTCYTNFQGTQILSAFIIQLVITRFLQIFQNVRTLPYTVSSKTNVFLNLEIVPIQIVTAIFQFST